MTKRFLTDKDPLDEPSIRINNAMTLDQMKFVKHVLLLVSRQAMIIIIVTDETSFRMYSVFLLALSLDCMYLQIFFTQ